MKKKEDTDRTRIRERNPLGPQKESAPPYLLLPCLGLRCLSRWFLRSPGPEDEADDEPDPPGPVDDTSWLIISHMSYCSDSISLELSLSEPWTRSSSSMNPLLHRGQTYSCKEGVLLYIQWVFEEYSYILKQLSIFCS